MKGADKIENGLLMQSNKGENFIANLTFQFSLKIIAYTEELKRCGDT